MKKYNVLTPLICLVVFMVSLVIMAEQFAVPAIYSSVIDDTANFVNWTRQFADYYKEGIYYPRWMPESFYGYGSPTFIFYQPLVIFITALFYSATNDPVVAVASIKLTGLFLSGIVLYFFINNLYGWKAGLVAAISFIVLPYRVFDVYSGGLYAGQFACVWFAPILYFARKTALEESTGKNTLLLALFYALLCITHLFSAYLFTPVLFVFGLVSGGKGTVGRTALRLTIALMFAFLLDAFYLLPIITDRQFVHFEVLQGSWWSDYRQNFLYYFPGSTAVQNNPEFSYQVFRSILLSVLFGGILYLGTTLVTAPKKTSEKIFFISLLLFSIFMMTSLSSPLWAVIPGLKLLAFPARLAPLTILSASCLAGIAVKDIELWYLGMAGGRGKTPLFFVIAVAVILLMSLVYLDAGIIKNSNRFYRQEIEALAGSDILEYVPNSVSIDWLKHKSAENPQRLVDVPGSTDEASVKLLKWGPVHRSFIIKLSQGTEVRLRTFYYPGWQCSIDGRPGKAKPEAQSGAILVYVPSGEHEISVDFREGASQRAGRLISAVSALTGLILYFGVMGRPRQARK